MNQENSELKNKRAYEAASLFYQEDIIREPSAIIHSASAFFESPVILMDSRCNVLIQDPEEEIGDNEWDACIRNHELPESMLSAFQKYFLSGKTVNKNQNIFYGNKEIAAKWPRIYGQIFSGNDMIGQITIFTGKRRLQPGDLEAAEELINALSISMQMKALREGRDIRADLPNTINVLLDPSQPLQVRYNAAQRLNKSLPGGYVIITVPIGEDAERRSFAMYAAEKVTRYRPDFVAFLHDNVLISLAGSIRTREDTTNSISPMVSYFTGHDMPCAVSEWFTDAMSMNLHYQQALITSELISSMNSQNAKVFSYTDLVPRQMFYTLSRTPCPEAYIHPLLPELREYDRIHHTDYFNTLRSYSYSMHNKDSTAVKLGIHRNTVLYRLNRIQEYFQVPIEDEKTAVHLLVSFLLNDELKYR